MTNAERRAIEQEILKYKSPYDSRRDFVWNEDKVSFSGSLFIDGGGMLKIDNLTTIGGYLSVYSKATLSALTTIGGYLSIHNNGSLNADNLTTIGGNLYIVGNGALNADRLTTIGGTK